MTSPCLLPRVRLGARAGELLDDVPRDGGKAPPPASAWPPSPGLPAAGRCAPLLGCEAIPPKVCQGPRRSSCAQRSQATPCPGHGGHCAPTAFTHLTPCDPLPGAGTSQSAALRQPSRPAHPEITCLHQMHLNVFTRLFSSLFLRVDTRTGTLENHSTRRAQQSHSKWAVHICWIC